MTLNGNTDKCDTKQKILFRIRNEGIANKKGRKTTCTGKSFQLNKTRRKNRKQTRRTLLIVVAFYFPFSPTSLHCFFYSDSIWHSVWIRHHWIYLFRLFESISHSPCTLFPMPRVLLNVANFPAEFPIHRIIWWASVWSHLEHFFPLFVFRSFAVVSLLSSVTRPRIESFSEIFKTTFEWNKCNLILHFFSLWLKWQRISRKKWNEKCIYRIDLECELKWTMRDMYCFEIEWIPMMIMRTIRKYD